MADVRLYIKEIEQLKAQLQQERERVEKLRILLDDLQKSVGEFMEEAEKGDIIRAQTTFPAGEAFVWDLREKYDKSKVALAELEAE